LVAIISYIIAIYFPIITGQIVHAGAIKWKHLACFLCKSWSFGSSAYSFAILNIGAFSMLFSIKLSGVGRYR